ncbi:Transmembrane protein, partial [Phytophthora megakarya]
QLSRGERVLIVVCSLYITFYVLFIIVMLRDSWGADITIFTSVVLYAILISILPSAGKAVFKELFKLIFRQRRKYFRAKASGGGDLKGFSFRLAFLLQFLVVLLLTLAQAPIFYIWAFRSCLFLKKFMYFGVLAAIMRMSLLGLVQDLAWYLIIKTWGWKDLCPYCTERIKHCDCFNDELLVLAVERVGPKWELIRVLDDLMSKQHHYDPQFELYTSEQLRERWEVLVERAEKHMEKIEKLRAYQEKKRLEALRHDRVRRSLTSFLSFRGTTHSDQPESGKQAEADEDDTTHRKSSDAASTSSSTEENRTGDSDVDCHVCSLREKKILELNNKIKLDTFEKHYDSNISEVFHALTNSVQKLRRHGHKSKTKSKSKGTSLEQIPEEDHSDSEHDGSKSRTHLESESRSSDGETMWVFDTPAQRLERREEEKLQRKRAFRVLNDYKIESVEATPEPRAPASPMLSPIMSRQGSMSAISGAAPLSTSRISQDTKKRPLLSTRNRPTTPRSEDLVILMPDDHKHKEEKVNLDEMATGCVEDYEDDDDEYPSDLERGTRQPLSNVPDQPPSTRVYSVTERPQTLFRRVSASASAFAAWALNYDPNVKY